MITPINAITPSGVCVIDNPRTTPVKANGIENIITNGSVSDSNWAAITMNTRMMINTINIPRSANVSCWSSKVPPNCQLISDGISIFFSSARVCSTRSLNAAPWATTAETVMIRSRFLRSIVGGVIRSTTLPTSRIRTPCPALL